jgi:hypothetical protein
MKISTIARIAAVGSFVAGTVVLAPAANAVSASDNHAAPAPAPATPANAFAPAPALTPASAKPGFASADSILTRVTNESPDKGGLVVSAPGGTEVLGVGEAKAWWKRVSTKKHEKGVNRMLMSMEGGPLKKRFTIQFTDTLTSAHIQMGAQGEREVFENMDENEVISYNHGGVKLDVMRGDTAPFSGQTHYYIWVKNG